jgi:serine/threonine protein kinase/Flp pilus assembly protein TadD
MPADRWLRVKAVLHGAMSCPADGRSAFLDAACGSDLALRSEVESLLASDSQSEAASFLDRPAAIISAVAEPASETSLIEQLSAALGDRYSVERELSGAGMSRVFVAQERALARQVVIKVLGPQQTHRVSMDRFAREVRFAARLQQANIVPVLSAGEAGGLAYYTMPYVSGESLRNRLSLGKPISLGETLATLKDIAKALAFAHQNGIVHRDIKPENVLFSGGTAVVTDFGIARAMSAARSTVDQKVATESRITAEGMVPGTPAYMSPEQVAGDSNVDARTDVYAFGVIAYELLAGLHPFAGKSTLAGLMASHLLEVPRDLSERRAELPRLLAALVMRCLEKDPAERYANGGDLLLALDAIELPTFGASTGSSRLETDGPSVAVLPLANLSGDPENEYFSDGIAAELLNALTHMRGLRVAARTSSFAFKGTNVDLRTIAQRLGVVSVLEGSVRRSGRRVRIAVQLVSAADGMSLWSESYDRELADIFAVQDEIAKAIAAALEKTLAVGADRGSALSFSTPSRYSAVDPDAFELYLRGRHLIEQRSEGMHEALRCFEQSIQLAPDFAPAHAGIAYALVAFGIYYALKPRDAFPRACDAAERALALDSTNGLALVMRAHTALWYEWDFARAESLARRALDLTPGFHLAHDCLGLVLAAEGRFDEAIVALERARTLDPLSQYASYDLAWVLILAGRWQDAIRELEPAVARHPRASELRRAFGFCLLYAGRVQEARAEFTRVLELSAEDRWGSTNVVQPLVALGEIEEARQLVDRIEARVPHEPIPQFGIAVAHHWLGEDQAALDWLERALDSRDYWLVMLRHDPSMMRLHGNPRFESVVSRVRADSSA